MTEIPIMRTWIVPIYYVVLHIISLICSSFILLQICLSRSRIFNSSKKRNSISANQKNQRFALKTLIFMLICDILLAVGDVSYVLFETIASKFETFQPTPESAADIRSNYWVFMRVLRSIGIVSYTLNYSSGCWSVCFAVALYLSLIARKNNIRFQWLWEIGFHFFATFWPLLVFVYWFSYRNITTETEFFKKNPTVDGIFVGSFYVYNAVVNIVLFVADIVVCLLIWRLVTKSISKIKHMSSVLKQRSRASEWKLMLRLSLFLLPFLLVGSANVIWYSYLAKESYTHEVDEKFLEYFVYVHSSIIPFKGIMNAFIYGFNVHRLDKLVARCCLFCCRGVKRAKKTVGASTSKGAPNREETKELVLNDEELALASENHYKYMRGNSLEEDLDMHDPIHTPHRVSNSVSAQDNDFDIMEAEAGTNNMEDDYGNDMSEDKSGPKLELMDGMEDGDIMEEEGFALTEEQTGEDV